MKRLETPINNFSSEDFSDIISKIKHIQYKLTTDDESVLSIRSKIDNEWVDFFRDLKKRENPDKWSWIPEYKNDMEAVTNTTILRAIVQCGVDSYDVEFYRLGLLGLPLMKPRTSTPGFIISDKLYAIAYRIANKFLSDFGLYTILHQAHLARRDGNKKLDEKLFGELVGDKWHDAKKINFCNVILALSLQICLLGNGAYVHRNGIPIVSDDKEIIRRRKKIHKLLKTVLYNCNDPVIRMHLDINDIKDKHSSWEHKDGLYLIEILSIYLIDGATIQRRHAQGDETHNIVKKIKSDKDLTIENNFNDVVLNDNFEIMRIVLDYLKNRGDRIELSNSIIKIMGGKYTRKELVQEYPTLNM